MSSLPEHALRTHDMLTRKRDTAALPPIRVQRKCGCGGTCGECGEKKRKVQRRALGETAPEVPIAVENVLRGPGRPLDVPTRSSMESRFRRSFADVRVHTDTHAAASARTIDAAAYTAGSHIVFGAGRFDPSSEKGRRLLAHELAHVVQQKSGASIEAGIGPADDVHEREADRVADSIVAQGPAFTPPVIAPAAERRIRRQREDDAEDREPHPAPLIVEDLVTPAPGQMRRSAFVEELDSAICTTADTEMRRLGQSTSGCPLLARWRPRIRQMSARMLEASIRRWGDEMENVRQARDYIPRVTQRLAQSIALWGATGRILGVPPDLLNLLGGPGGAIRIGVGDLIRGAIGGLFRKSRDGAAAPADAAPTLAFESGAPLDAATSSRMASAFGRDFSGVRIHTGADAAGEVSRMGARAFTIGEHIAFADGEYRPGTPIGDALLAHELAHVAQQDGATELAPKSDGENGALERDADDVAVHAVASLWPAVRRYARGLHQNAMPRLKSSLRLQRCDHTADLTVNQAEQTRFTQEADVSATGCTFEERNSIIEGTGIGSGRTRNCCTPKMIGELRALYPEALARVRKAIEMLAPEQRGNFDDPLRDHFRITSANTNEINTIIGNYRSMLSVMEGARAQFFCRSRQSDAGCSEEVASTTCSDYGITIKFCGDYEASLPVGQIAGESQRGAAPRDSANRELRGSNAPFLYPRNERSQRTDETYNGWVRTMIHEHAHATCSGMRASVGADREVYFGDSGYPGTSALAIRNPDSYARFAMDVSRVKTTNAAQLTAPLPPMTAQQAAGRVPTGTIASSCPPNLGPLEARIDGRPHLINEEPGRCKFQLGRVEGGQLAEGAQIYGSVQVDTSCHGKLFWVQYVKRRQTSTHCSSAAPYGLCSPADEGWGIDTSWPYTNASRYEDLHDVAGTRPIWLGDLPGSLNISGAYASRFCINHEFVSYLVYESPQQQHTPLAWVSWRMVATAIRDNNRCPAREGGGCDGWSLTPDSFAERTGISRNRGAMHPQVPLNREAPRITAGLGFTDCPANSCPPEGVRSP